MKPTPINPYETQEAYRTLFEQAPDAVVAISEHNRIIFWNPKAEDIFGWKAEEVIGQPLTDFIIPPAHREAHSKGMQRFLATGEVRVLNRTIEVPAINKEGEEFFIALTIAKTLLEGNTAFLAFIRDITEQKQSQEILIQKTQEVERSAAKLLTVLDTSQAGVFLALPVMDDQGQIIDFTFTMVNNVVAQFTGLSPEALNGELGSRWFARYKTNGLFERFQETYLTGTKQQFAFHYVGKTAEAWANVMITKIGEELFCSFTDFTTLKQTELQLEQTIRELKRSNAYLEDFAHAASHDMKEPIRKIRTFTDRLKSSLGNRVDENESRLIERIETSAERMQLLVDDLLEFSHVSEHLPQKEVIALPAALQGALANLELLIEEKRATITVTDPLPTIQGNSRQLQQLLENLINNSLKYSKPDTAPAIQIACALVKGADVPVSLSSKEVIKHYYLITIRDNGIGFEQQYAEQIFNMFQRLHGKAEYSGTGIGLSIVRKIVQNHEGYIWAQSEPGRGTTFSFLLPAF